MAVNIAVQETPEKLRAMAEALVPSLLELLRARSALEDEIDARCKELDKAKLAAGIAYNQAAPGEPALWAEYRRRYLALVENRCVPGFLKYGAANSFGRPAKYAYLDDSAECLATVIMKSAKKAVVETCYANGYQKKRHRFTLKLTESGWLISKVEYADFDEVSWHIDHYL